MANDKHVDRMIENLRLAIAEERQGWSKFAATAFTDQAKMLRIRENVEAFVEGSATEEYFDTGEAIALLDHILTIIKGDAL